MARHPRPGRRLSVKVDSNLEATSVINGYALGAGLVAVLLVAVLVVRSGRATAPATTG